MSEESTEDLTLGDLLPDDFVAEFTEFDSRDELLAEAGLIADTPANHHTLAGAEFDQFIEARTHFDSWSDMRDTAMDRYERGGV